MRNWFRNLQTGSYSSRFDHRFVFSGVDDPFDSGGIDAPATSSLGSRRSMYRPRLDCSRDSGSSNVCVASIPESLTTGSGDINNSFVKIVRLNQPQAGGAWGSHISKHNMAADIATEPDVAINSDGTQAYLAYASEQSHNIRIRKVNLITGATVDRSTGVRASGPPRISYVHDDDRVLVLFRDLTFFQNWNGFAFAANNLSGTLTQIQAGTSVNAAFATINTALPWDFDCREGNPPSVDRGCILVGVGVDRLNAVAFDFVGTNMLSNFTPSGPGVNNKITGVHGVSVSQTGGCVRFGSEEGERWLCHDKHPSAKVLRYAGRLLVDFKRNIEL